MAYNGPRVAVIGSGFWGKNLIRNHHEIGSLKLICDKNENVLEGFKKQYADVDTCLAVNEVYSDRRIEGVVIATPAETHYAIACEALLANKHVYVEKPLVLDETEAEALIQLAKDKEADFNGWPSSSISSDFYKIEGDVIKRRIGQNQLYLFKSTQLRKNPARREYPLVFCTA
jgi:hypothetical protein